MKFAAITLLVSVAGASALGIKPAKAPMAETARRMQESIEKVQVSVNNMFMQTRRLDAHEGGGLDMGGMMKPECAEACPGVTDLAKKFMEMATASTTAAPAGKEGEAQMAMMTEIMCPHMDTIDCMGKSDKCKSSTRRLDAHEDEGQDIMGMIGCICECPDLASMMGSRRRLDAHEGGDDDASLKAMCKNPEGTIGCMTSKSECDSLETMMKKSMPESMQDNMMGYLGVACDYSNEKCEEKSEMTDCEGGADAQKEFSEKGCDKAETTDKTPCCPAVETMKTCQGATCMKLNFAMASMSPEPEAQEVFTQMIAISKACPDVGMPQSKEETTAVMKASEAKMKGEDAPGGGESADSAFHTIPVLGMVATFLVVALLGEI